MNDAIFDLNRLAIDTGQPLHALYHRHAMEGVLRRTAATPEGEILVLRGSLITRFWARPAYRPVLDVDYVATYPFDPDRAAATIRAACSVALVEDGIRFHPEEMRVEVTWADTPFPGSRFQIPATVDGHEVRVQVDVGYDDPLVPTPIWIEIPTLLTWSRARVLACRPELACAWKVHGLFEFPWWRAKDLHDIDLIIRNTLLDRGMLSEGLRVAFESRQTPLASALRLFRGEFGRSRGSRTKWAAFRRERSDPSIPADHFEVVRSVADFLRPIYEELVGSLGGMGATG
jgi:hypothetical protein